MMAKGEITHIECPADDGERAKRFYSAVAGWEFDAMDGYPNYWLFRSAKPPVVVSAFVATALAR